MGRKVRILMLFVYNLAILTALLGSCAVQVAATRVLATKPDGTFVHPPPMPRW